MQAGVHHQLSACDAQIDQIIRETGKQYEARASSVEEKMDSDQSSFFDANLNPIRRRANRGASQERIWEAQKELARVLIESRREFERGLLVASPQELLQKLAVVRLESAPGGMSAGHFMALSPQTRRDYEELHGGETGAYLREKLRLLKAQALTAQEAEERKMTLYTNYVDVFADYMDYTQRKAATARQSLPAGSPSSRYGAAAKGDAAASVEAQNQYVSAFKVYTSAKAQNDNGADIANSGSYRGPDLAFLQLMVNEYGLPSYELGSKE